VRVGTVPDGATTEVYIAPQQSQKKKSKANDERGDTSSSSVASLTLLPDARAKTLDDLQLQYGDTLRVAVDAETSFAAITGSHVRVRLFLDFLLVPYVDVAMRVQPPKLTPMIYTALQFITRGREHGITIVDLGKKSGYDQKTCFYLIKQLLELELVVKLRRGGVGTNFCIHKYFFERSPLWRQIQDEGVNSVKDTQAEGGIDNEETSLTQDGFQVPIKFDPIDARHLSSLSLIQSRIVKLLKHSESHTHPSQNLLVTIVSKNPYLTQSVNLTSAFQGFSNPTKTDRRFFQSRLKELIENHIVERVMGPSVSKSGPASVPSIRLVVDNNNAPTESSESPTRITQDLSVHGVTGSYARSERSIPDLAHRR
jgi:oxalate---CoA ligase